MSRARWLCVLFFAATACAPAAFAGPSGGKDWKVSFREYDAPTPKTLVAFDPATETFAHWPIPSGGGVVRNMEAGPDGRLYLACSGVNKVAVVDISR